MVKKADALVRTYSNRMHTIDSALTTFTTMSQPQDIQAAMARTGTTKFFADKSTKPSNPVTPSASTPVKSAMRNSRTPSVSFKGNERHPVAHTAKESKVQTTPVSSVAATQSRTQNPQKDVSKVD